MQTEREFIDNIVAEFRRWKERADRALAQVPADGFFAALDAESNSIAIIMKHMAGNMRSRWTNFLASDGEKGDRNRDSEFVIDKDDTRDSLKARWEHGWRILFESLARLKPQDLSKTVLIRSEPHSVVQVLHRDLAHCANHVGQIVLLAKHFSGSKWQPLTIPRGKSEEFNSEMKRRWRAGT